MLYGIVLAVMRTSFYVFSMVLVLRCLVLHKVCTNMELFFSQPELRHFTEDSINLFPARKISAFFYTMRYVNRKETLSGNAIRDNSFPVEGEAYHS